MGQDWLGPEPAQIQAIAKDLAQARREGTALTAFPGAPPQDMITAYRIQEMMIPMMAAPIAAWRSQLVPPAFTQALKANRIFGPIFTSGIIRPDPDAPIPIACPAGWRMTASLELIFELGGAAPAEKFDWTMEEAIAHVAALRWGVVIGASPFAAISDFGPAFVTADLGGAHALILGPAIADWPSLDLSALRGHLGAVETAIAPAAPDDIFEALREALIHCAVRARPPAIGALISAGPRHPPIRLDLGMEIAARFDAQSEHRPHSTLMIHAVAGQPTV
jgi:2-keto-4-pentenoate hydratase